MARRTLRIFRLGEETKEDDGLTPEQRLTLISELTLSAYAFKGEDVAAGIRRDVVRVVKRGRKVLGCRRPRRRRAR